jgi:hypothetical protein
MSNAIDHLADELRQTVSKVDGKKPFMALQILLNRAVEIVMDLYGKMKRGNLARPAAARTPWTAARGATAGIYANRNHAAAAPAHTDTRRRKWLILFLGSFRGQKNGYGNSSPKVCLVTLTKTA